MKLRLGANREENRHQHRFIYEKSLASFTLQTQYALRTETLNTPARNAQIAGTWPTNAECPHCDHIRADATHIFQDCPALQPLREQCKREAKGAEKTRPNRYELWCQYIDHMFSGPLPTYSQYWMGNLPPRPEGITTKDLKDAHNVAITTTARLWGRWLSITKPPTIRLTWQKPKGRRKQTLDPQPTGRSSRQLLPQSRESPDPPDTADSDSDDHDSDGHRPDTPTRDPEERDSEEEQAPSHTHPRVPNSDTLPGTVPPNPLQGTSPPHTSRSTTQTKRKAPTPTHSPQSTRARYKKAARSLTPSWGTLQPVTNEEAMATLNEQLADQADNSPTHPTQTTQPPKSTGSPTPDPPTPSPRSRSPSLGPLQPITTSQAIEMLNIQLADPPPEKTPRPSALNVRTLTSRTNTTTGIQNQPQPAPGGTGPIPAAATHRQPPPTPHPATPRPLPQVPTRPQGPDAPTKNPTTHPQTPQTLRKRKLVPRKRTTPPTSREPSPPPKRRSSTPLPQDNSDEDQWDDDDLIPITPQEVERILAARLNSDTQRREDKKKESLTSSKRSRPPDDEDAQDKRKKKKKKKEPGDRKKRK